MDLFFSLQGRIGRGKFWLGLLGLMVFSVVASMVLGAFGAQDIDPATGEPGAMFMVGTLVLLLITLWPSICIYGKRYHDRDKSAWWILIALVPIIGPIWMLIECGLLRGTDGPNRFGEDPLA